MLLKVGATIGRVVFGYACGYILGEGIDKVQAHYKKKKKEHK